MVNDRKEGREERKAANDDSGVHKPSPVACAVRPSQRTARESEEQYKEEQCKGQEEAKNIIT